MTAVQERPTQSATLQLPTYASILVHVEPELAASPRVDVAVRLARQFGAHLIGVGAEAMDYRFLYDGGPMIAELAKAAEEQVDENLRRAEAAFKRDAGSVDNEWRQARLDPARFVVRSARAADLVIVGPAKRNATARSIGPADIVMESARPVLIVPASGGHLQARCIVIAWKDTREARRAVAAAMPFLTRAEDVIVLSVCSADQTETIASETDDVVQWLKRHGVPARAVVTPSTEDQVAHELDVVASLEGADLIVAGAYGHNRTMEWAFGGVTDDLLHKPSRFVLMSH